jgi:hypothetical protein
MRVPGVSTCGWPQPGSAGAFVRVTTTQRTTGDDCMAVREAEPVGSLQEVKDAGLDREDLLGMYRSMILTGGIEERGHILYKQGKIPGSFYTGRGN